MNEEQLLEIEENLQDKSTPKKENSKCGVKIFKVRYFFLGIHKKIKFLTNKQKID